MSTVTCELMGGAKDGQVLMLAIGPDGLPVPHIRMVLAPTLADLMAYPPTDPTLIPHQYLIYSRDVVSDITHRWLYRLRGIA